MKRVQANLFNRIKLEIRNAARQIVAGSGMKEGVGITDRFSGEIGVVDDAEFSDDPFSSPISFFSMFDIDAFDWTFAGSADAVQYSTGSVAGDTTSYADPDPLLGAFDFRDGQNSPLVLQV